MNPKISSQINNDDCDRKSFVEDFEGIDEYL